MHSVSIAKRPQSKATDVPRMVPPMVAASMLRPRHFSQRWHRCGQAPMKLGKGTASKQQTTRAILLRRLAGTSSCWLMNQVHLSSISMIGSTFLRYCVDVFMNCPKTWHSNYSMTFFRCFEIDSFTLLKDIDNIENSLCGCACFQCGEKRGD